MEYKNEENGVVIGKTKKFSAGKFCAWLSLFLLMTSALFGIGIGILACSFAKEDERKEVYLIASISIGIALFLVLLEAITGFALIIS